MKPDADCPWAWIPFGDDWHKKCRDEKYKKLEAFVKSESDPQVFFPSFILDLHAFIRRSFSIPALYAIPLQPEFDRQVLDDDDDSRYLFQARQHYLLARHPKVKTF